MIKTYQRDRTCAGCHSTFGVSFSNNYLPFLGFNVVVIVLLMHHTAYVIATKLKNLILKISESITV
jgi:hypothetical protein